MWLRLAASLGVLFALVVPLHAEPRLSEAAGWLQEYLRIDTTNPPGQEHRAAAFLAYLLHRERIETRTLTTAEGRVCLWARLPATRPSGRGALLLTHHMDVVPAGPRWTVEPFSGVVSEGRLWGRGALDTKGLGIAHLAAMIDLKRRQVPLDRDLVFLAVADEELGGAQGMAWLWQHHPELFEGVEAVFNEGGSCRVNPQGVMWWEVEVAQKRPLWLRAKVKGQAGHASAYAPDSAAHVLVSGLARMLALEHPFRVTPPVRQYFHAIAPLHKNQQLQRTFGQIDAVLAEKGLSGLVFSGLKKLLVDTVQVTVLSASSSINVIAGEASAEIDARLLPDTDSDQFLDRLSAALGKEIEVEVLLTTPPAEPSPTTNAAWKAIAAGLGPQPIVPAMGAGFTDSRHFRQRGIAAYGVQPFAVEGEDAAGIHAADERLALLELDRGIERMRKILESFLLAR